MASAHKTTDHEKIQRWAEERGGKPARVKNTSRDSEPGVIRLYFPYGGKPDELEDISWDEWFEKVDDSDLALLYQEKTDDGQKSNFNKLVHREGNE